MTKKKTTDLQNDLQGANKEVKILNKDLDKTKKQYGDIRDIQKELIEGTSSSAKRHAENYKNIGAIERRIYNIKKLWNSFNLTKSIAQPNPIGFGKAVVGLAKNEKNAPEPASSAYTNRQKGTTKDIYEQSRDQHFNKESKTEIAYDIGKSAIKLAEASIKYNKEKGNEEEVVKKEKELAEKRIKISAEILKLNEEEIFHLENGLPEVIKEVETAFNKIDNRYYSI